MSIRIVKFKFVMEEVNFDIRFRDKISGTDPLNQRKYDYHGRNVHTGAKAAYLSIYLYIC